MHPAFSVILLTTLIGAAQGLYLAVFSAEVATALGVIPAEPSLQFYATGSLIALVLLGVGLAASFFHLGRPERAWRAVLMWRTSWLSREVIVLPATMLAVAAYGLVHYLSAQPEGEGPSGLSLVTGSAAALLCFALFICTGMIYACIRFLQEWASPLTLINYVLLGTSSGFTLATAFAVFSAEDLVVPYAVAAVGLTAAAFVSRTASLVRNARLRPRSTLQTATGIKRARIVQKSKGFVAASFNTREFFHGRSQNFVRHVKWVFLVLVFPMPMLLLVIGMLRLPSVCMPLAFAVQYIGLVAERWYFFAEANHPQNIYYQAIG